MYQNRLYVTISVCVSCIFFGFKLSYTSIILAGTVSMYVDKFELDIFLIIYFRRRKKHNIFGTPWFCIYWFSQNPCLIWSVLTHIGQDYKSPCIYLFLILTFFPLIVLWYNVMSSIIVLDWHALLLIREMRSISEMTPLSNKSL